MNPRESTTYNLGSSPMVCAPGIIPWAQSVYSDQPETATRIVSETWGIPSDAAEALVSGAVDYTVHDEIVTFTYPPAQE